MTESQAKVVIEFFNHFGEAIRRAFLQLEKVMRTWFPAVRSAHQETVRAVHTEYHRRQKARRRRARRKR